MKGTRQNESKKKKRSISRIKDKPRRKEHVVGKKDEILSASRSWLAPYMKERKYV